MDSTLQWQKIADNISELPFGSNNMCVVQAHHKQITLALHHNQLYAFAYKCPHAGAVMANGYIDALGNAVCPLHRYKFSILNGRNTTGEGYCMSVYKVEMRPNDGIYIGIKPSFLQSWLS